MTAKPMTRPLPRMLLGIGAALALSACTQTTQLPETPDPAARSQSVGPGPGLVQGAQASTMFKQICVDTLPRFAGAKKSIGALPFRKHPKTGTYFHTDLDLSIKIGKFAGSSQNRCSMVFASRDDPTQLALFMSLGVKSSAASGNVPIGVDAKAGAAGMNLSGGAKFTFAPTGRSDGRNYYRAVIAN